MIRPKSLTPFALALLLLSPPLAALSAGAAQETTQIRRTLALTYPEGPTISIKFQGTERLPRSSGEAKVERKKGMTEIEIELDEMKPAGLFGGDYNTYVLWAASPEGHTDNLGEFILEGNRSKLNVTTGLETFGLFITAEPHFLVKSPSRFVVMENTRPTNDIAPLKISRIEYRGFQGYYNFQHESLSAAEEADDEVRSHIESARTAVELARRAGAEQFAPDEFEKARNALTMAEQMKDRAPGNQMIAGHEAVRLAVKAQELAQERAVAAALRAERQRNAAEIDGLEDSIAAARSEAERNRLEAEQRELQLRLEEKAREQAMEAAREEARRAARAEARAEQMEREAEAASREAARARNEADAARGAADAARREWEATRSNLRAALGRLTTIRETARGLVVDIPDVLFDFDKATLKPDARELLSKMAGIMLVSGEFSVRVEGHTDSIGPDEYNMKLSRRRAESVRDYLVEAGLPGAIFEIEAFGETQPVADNDTTKGRQENRRVELHIEEPVIS